MESKFEKLEKTFVDYIINLVGPNEENEIERSEKLEVMKRIITSSFESESNIIPHIFCFGSFPMKTYLPESDMDVTIILEDRLTGTIITKYSYEFLNKILSLIQNSLESFAQESGYPPLISEISLIMADVKLIKCKYEDLAFDISINNFVGLCKLILINAFEKNLNQKKNLFKRSLFLIKSWCYYEGSLLGSNLGLLASYALEVIVMFIFNKHCDSVKTEVDALFYFFEQLNEFNWEKDILSVLGRVSLDEFQEEFKTNLSPLENLQKNLTEKNQVFTFQSLKGLNLLFEKFADLDKIQNFNSNKKIFAIKYLNIIDPMFNNNNLGKSVNLHNYNKFVKAIEYEVELVREIKELRFTDNFFADKYLNLLLLLFEKTVTYNNSELFFYNLPQPKVFISPDNYTEEGFNAGKDLPAGSSEFFEDEFSNKLEIKANTINKNDGNFNANYRSASHFSNKNPNEEMQIGINHNLNLDFAPGFGLGFMENAFPADSINNFPNSANGNNPNNLFNCNHNGNTCGNDVQNKNDLKTLTDNFNKFYEDHIEANKKQNSAIPNSLNTHNKSNFNYYGINNQNFASLNTIEGNSTNNTLNERYRINENQKNLNTNANTNSVNNNVNSDSSNLNRIERKVDLFNDFIFDENNKILTFNSKQNKDSNMSPEVNNVYSNYNENRNTGKNENNAFDRRNEKSNNLYEYANKNSAYLSPFLWPHNNEIENPKDINNTINYYSESTKNNLISKEILDFIAKNIENRSNNTLCFSNVNEIDAVENFLKNCKFNSQ